MRAVLQTVNEKKIMKTSDITVQWRIRLGYVWITSWLVGAYDFIDELHCEESKTNE